MVQPNFYEHTANIKLKIVFEDKLFFAYLSLPITLEILYQEIKCLCKLSTGQTFTIKWIDSESDPCTISSQTELDEAIRLNQIKESIVLYVFNGVPAPGQFCVGENKFIYKRGAKRWRKHYKISGHLFEPRRFKIRSYCAYCLGRVWGLGKQDLKCTLCNILVHGKCYKNIGVSCSMEAKHFYEKQKRFSLSDFDLLKVIGRGSYAKVLLVELRRTKRLYAMKVIRKDGITDDDLEWIRTEKRVFKLVSNRPFFIGLQSSFQTLTRLFFVMEFARGGDLMNHMQKQKKLPENHGRFYAAEISLALNFLHNHGIIYRDLKLDNVLLDHEGHVKLTDYGMCKEGVDSVMGTTTFCGTPNYIAPEVLEGKNYGFTVDWWALGVLIYEMLVGRSPFLSENFEDYSEDCLFQIILQKPIRIPRNLSTKASNVLRGFLNKDPLHRLGCRKPEGFNEVLRHPFFQSIQWNKLEAKQIKPPYIPDLKGKRDLSNFPAEFLNETVFFSLQDSELINTLDQSIFRGFDYVNPFLMSEDITVL
ncbi:atypical protein kinase C-like [Diorhabda carinulata]|uniref:atypical protein kinase C-like n=1 Tax=Diorhabda carinulata TaxID=1163345 RepID=UPI0025A041A8|nr:atypical protein kinase C-like [Diorhabda carinulata]